MSSANRSALAVRNTATNATTGDSIIDAIRAGLPDGVTAEWSQWTPFQIIPATTSEQGRISGLIIITANNHYRSAINLNIVIPRLSE